MNITVEGNTITVTRPSRTIKPSFPSRFDPRLVANMVTGVFEGFTKTFEINGVGYRAAKQGNKLVSTPWLLSSSRNGSPAGITIDVPVLTKSLCLVQTKKAGAVAADIRKWRNLTSQR